MFERIPILVKCFNVFQFLLNVLMYSILGGVNTPTRRGTKKREYVGMTDQFTLI